MGVTNTYNSLALLKEFYTFLKKIYLSLGSQGQRGATLPECGLNLLVSASLLLERVGLRLRNAEIDMHTLRILQENRASFLSLCSLVSEVDGNAESSENDETTKCDKNQREISSVELFLDMRIDELEAFAKEREAVNSFVEMCSMVKSGELRNLSSLFLRDHVRFCAFRYPS